MFLSHVFAYMQVESMQDFAELRRKIGDKPYHGAI